jgi:glutathione synthase/RimK-type ligase-like ATP-grasp enzyme
MKVFLLRRKGSGIETFRGIVEKSQGSLRCIRDTKLRRVESPDVLIRWGSTVPFTSRFVINSILMIEKMNNKVESRKSLENAGISVPTSYFSKQSASLARVFPLIGRNTYHSQGKGMRICQNPQDIVQDMSSAYWSEFIPKTHEYRVYVFFGRVLGVCQKIPRYPEAIAWNNSTDNGIFQTLKKYEWPKGVCKLALQACGILNVDFSGVDIISKDEESWVIELNSAPTCSEYRQELFARGFKWVIREIERTGEKPKHFEVLERVRSFKDLQHPILVSNKEE